MKLQITFKDPDGVSECCDEAVKESLGPQGGSETMAERESRIEIRTEALRRQLSKWLQYHEYVTIEFDTDAGTATVMPAR